MSASGSPSRMRRVNATEWAAIGSAGASVAAFASWASVFQSRRERIAASTPDLHLEVIEAFLGDGTRELEFHIVSAGGLAKRVRFVVVQGERMATGYAPPVSTFRPGESRLFKTNLLPLQENAPGLVACWNASFTRFYVWPSSGGRRIYRKKTWTRRARKFDVKTLMAEFYPAFGWDPNNATAYELVERN
jgi:hypothetical protein